MRTLNILCLLASSVLTFTQGYEVKCKQYYITKVDEKCLSIVNKNEISLKLFTTINPDIDCSVPVPAKTEVCVKGLPFISFDGTCGPTKGSCPFGECCYKGKCTTTKSYCSSTACDPKYGLCGSDVDNSAYGTKSYKNSVEDYDSKSISTLVGLFSLTTTEAKTFYAASNSLLDYFDKAFIDSVNANLSVKNCQLKCTEAQSKLEALLSVKSPFSFTRFNKFLNAMGTSTINKTELLEMCLNQCFVIKELNDYVAEYGGKSYVKSSTMNKRATDARRDTTRCYPTSEAKFVTVYNYLNGYNKYTEASDSVITALNFVNGCSVPVIKDLYNENNRGLFVPACNVHDICYGCQGGKDSCDLTFYNNMKEICKNQKKNSLVCRATAGVFYAAVKIGAKRNYNACSNNVTSKSCAYCGAPVIQNSLLKTPYYTI